MIESIEETIAHHRWCADNCEGEVRDEHLQMVAWLEELVELRAENAKLRELLVDACGYINHPANVSWTHMRRKEARDSLNGRMRELGVEANDE